MNNHLGSPRPARLARRAGISLFEVLVSILVAAIGVFGVILLLPFAWETAERGIDRENAINAVRNHIADLQTWGYHRSESWLDDSNPPESQTPAPWNDNGGVTYPQPDPTGTTPSLVQNGSNIVGGWPYLLDPVGAAGSAAYGQFPLPTANTPNLPRINRINLQDVNGLPFRLDLARRVALQHDDLVFNEPADELGPPRQAWFSVSDITTAKRQYEGRYAMITFLVPGDDNRQQYRMFTLVGRAGDRNRERVFAVDTSGLTKSNVPQRGYEGVLLGGGDVLLSEDPNTFPGVPGLPAPVEEHQIRNGDWIMLINYYRTADPASDLVLPLDDPQFDDIQINFYQVLNASKVNGDPSGNDAEDFLHTVTLQGPDFDVFRDWAVKSPGQGTGTSTYAILIPNVLTVYERTLRAEQPSLWTNP
jgi:type II secretory pathway pseudopilin PulG